MVVMKNFIEQVDAAYPLVRIVVMIMPLDNIGVSRPVVVALAIVPMPLPVLRRAAIVVVGPAVVMLVDHDMPVATVVVTVAIAAAITIRQRQGGKSSAEHYKGQCQQLFHGRRPFPVTCTD